MSRSSGAAAPHPGLYDDIGRGYSQHRRPDARIQAQIDAALADAERICNVGAGTGAYEPQGRSVTAVEPSREMLAQRVRPAVRGVGEALPFTDAAFDAALAVLTVHHWQDLDRGLAELRRVAPRRVVFAFDPALHGAFWLVGDYLPEIVALDRSPDLSRLAAGIAATRTEVIPIPWDCTDGFMAAYWRRPERYLEPDVRACISVLALLDDAVVARGIGALRQDLESGRWEERHGELLQRETMDYGYRLLIADPS